MPYYATFRPATDGLKVCSECGSIVSSDGEAIHDAFHAAQPSVPQIKPAVAVISSRVTGRTQARQELWEASVASGLFEQYRSPSGRLSPRWHCTTCGVQGAVRGDGDSPIGGWWVPCAEGHPLGCSCGRVFATRAGQAGHLRGVARHRPDEKHVPQDSGTYSAQ